MKLDKSFWGIVIKAGAKVAQAWGLVAAGQAIVHDAQATTVGAVVSIVQALFPFLFGLGADLVGSIVKDKGTQEKAKATAIAIVAPVAPYYQPPSSPLTPPKRGL
jgi:hypothetical protein